MRYMWSYRDGYLVYRHFSDLACTADEMATAHKVAVFVTEAEAQDYCDYRNAMMHKHGTDDVRCIKWPNDMLTVSGGREKANAKQ